MGSIEFHDLHGAARLRGPERPWVHSLVHGLSASLLASHPDPAETAGFLYGLLPDDHYLQETPFHREVSPTRWLRGYVDALGDIFDDPIVEHRGHTVRPTTLLLNTAMHRGDEALRLAARLAGQCELNCYIEGPNRAWLAGVVATGLASGQFRAPCGWLDVQRLLLERDDQPVVVSFGEEFPNLWAAAYSAAEGLDPVEEWEGLTHEAQWKLGMQALRARTADGLEITPDWADYRFGPALALTDLLAEDRSLRLDQVLRPSR